MLVICPAPLTVQWQEELLDKFDEHFELLDSHKVRWQLGGNAWQQHDRVIASVDFAKRDEVLPDLLLADWDLVVVDEAHNCSAVSRWEAIEEREKLERTKKYALAEELSRRSERLLLMTATAHSGDPTRFQNFLKLLDPDQFALAELARDQIGREDSPYFLRRQKEDLKDEHGADLFVPREVKLQPFELSEPELRLYEAVTDYIREFLGHVGGRKGNAIALAHCAATPSGFEPRCHSLVAREASRADQDDDRGGRAAAARRAERQARRAASRARDRRRAGP